MNKNIKNKEKTLDHFFSVLPSKPNSNSDKIDLDSLPDDPPNHQITEVTDGDNRDPVKGYENAKISLTLNEGPFQPKNVLYPLRNGRKFREIWFTQYKWLEYSIALDSAFCFFCRAFYKSNKMDDAFTCKGYSNWKKAIEKFNNHQKSNIHLESSVKVDEFTKSLRKNSGTIVDKLDSQVLRYVGIMNTMKVTIKETSLNL
ncbi:unnamed protein product [Macrosiphum euphorbiae]|uniref:TTF-type domain-containing protein n=1 Tax=Macrosiphum euphorbiae TaxID=13131 RepID=A0AAV0XPH2_9HEMI|nr:unnamed protein product [Macrosiphum euphorbiae]